MLKVLHGLGARAPTSSALAWLCQAVYMDVLEFGL